MCVRGCLVSGNANNGSNAGLAYSNANNSPSNANANIGSRLRCNNNKNNSVTHKLCHLAENNNFKDCFGSIITKEKSSYSTMKRIGNIYNRIIDIDNLFLADENARKGKTNSYGVKCHDKRREENIKKLHELLKNKDYKTSSYNIFKIYEPKERQIFQLPYFPDRIVHHAIMNILEPIWVDSFTTDSYSCIKKRGIHGCVKSVKKALKDIENTQYCLKIDIRKFYPTIDHDILKQIVRRKIKCKDTLDLIDEIINSANGVPIGNYLSQYLANLYLTYFDHWLKEDVRVKYYFRYADDMVFLAHDKAYLHSLLVQINDYLVNNLNLYIKDNYQVFPVDSRGIDFVGYIFRHDYVLIRKSIKIKFSRKVRRLKKNGVDEKQFKQVTSSWYGWCKHANAINLLKKYSYDSTL